MNDLSSAEKAVHHAVARSFLALGVLAGTWWGAPLGYWVAGAFFAYAIGALAWSAWKEGRDLAGFDYRAFKYNAPNGKGGVCMIALAHLRAARQRTVQLHVLLQSKGLTMLARDVASIDRELCDAITEIARGNLGAPTTTEQKGGLGCLDTLDNPSHDGK